MNRYSAAIISIGLSLILINNYGVNRAIAKQVIANPINNCSQIGKQSFISSKTIPVDHIIDQANLVASTKTTFDATQSSLWWATLQFDPFDGKLVQNWFAHPQKQQINLVVNWQLWTLLDYFGRYRFVNQFGTVARKYGYSLNIFNQKDQCLASYKYNSTSIPPKWELNLEQLGRSSLSIEPPPQQPSIIETP